MCKHILIRDLKTDDSELIKQFIEKSQNESDGYGAMIRTNDGIVVIKNLDIGGFYLDLGRWIQSGEVIDLVIHHRFCTNEQGLDYAHPFEFEGHYLTHNGVVQVPGKHDTQTKNDSEALLHHLIKTNYDTKAISGYFSCFLFNKLETIILVDDIAPIYTDGRVYSSHQLNESMLKITMQKIVYDLNGISSSIPIETTKTDYGKESKRLSLGAWSDEPWNFKDESEWMDRDYPTDDFNYFLDCLNDNDIQSLAACRNNGEMSQEIQALADMIDVKLTKEQIELAIQYFARLVA